MGHGATKSGGAAALVEAMRVRHWTKNVFVLAALPFSGKWTDPSAWAMAWGAFAAFCLLSSAIYLINDIADRKSDLAHPVKNRRPIASGRLSPSLAAGAAGVLLIGGAGIVALLSWKLYRPGLPIAGMGLAAWSGAYVLINLAYSLGLKGRAILDVLIVAMGFVLRAMAGASAIAAVISPWLVVCTFMLCLFIALAKRRGEIVALGDDAAGQTRRANRFYTPANIEHMLAVSAGLAILTYSLYCLAPATVERIGSSHLIWTIPLVVYGMFRYYCLTLSAGGDDPVGVLIRDKVLWLVAAAWLVCVIVVLRWGGSEAVRGLLLQ
ncbi:MAG: decaprenyl-phosphate phosphoribosyltransferase [Planctomycetota bacterium]|nr:decaprenyl-phosphate phosphoribosyltransferase [Planctomycetota bacterium]